MKRILEKLERRKELKDELEMRRNDIRGSKRVIDSINHELDLIRDRKFNTMSPEEYEAYIGTLLQKKIKEEQLIVVAALRIVSIEDTLKELF